MYVFKPSIRAPINAKAAVCDCRVKLLNLKNSKNLSTVAAGGCEFIEDTTKLAIAPKNERPTTSKKAKTT